MKLTAVHIKNFRGIHEQLDLNIVDFTALIGKNEAGKSTILEALAIFFGEQKIDVEDACKNGDKTQVAIGCEFSDLPASIVLDATHFTTLDGEKLLNENNQLEIWKVFDCTKKTIPQAVYANAVLPTDEELRDLLLLKLPALKKIIADRGISTDGVNLTINSETRQCIRNASSATEVALYMFPLDKEDARAIWEQIEKQLPVYALFKSDRPSTDQDEEAQDPMKLAVDEALKAQQANLDTIAGIVKEEVVAIAQKTLKKLQELAPELASELSPQFANPDWSKVFKISLSSDQGVAVNKRGSGVRRLILLSFFRAKVEGRAQEKNVSGVIYAIEEPETSQHPNNQRLLCQALMELSEQEGCQVLISTHTPGLARTLPLTSLRYIRVGVDGARDILSGSEETYGEICKTLGVHRDHDVKLFIMIEGANDIEFLKGFSSILLNAGEDVPDLQTLEDEGKIIFVPTGGSSLIYWKNRLEGIHVGEFHLYDRDAAPGQQSLHQGIVDDINRDSRCSAVLTGKREMENYIHPAAIASIYGSSVTITAGPGDDVPMLVAEQWREVCAPGTWAGLSDKDKKKFDSYAKVRLNSECVRAMTSDLLTQIDPDNDVRGWLGEIACKLSE